MSKFILFLATVLMTATISAATIGHVEYNLPKEASEWEIQKGIVSSKENSTIVIWTPIDTTKHGVPKESFGAYLNKDPNNIPFSTNKVDLEKGLQDNFPNGKVNVNILEQVPESTLFEWSVEEGSLEKFHGWTRVFFNSNETVMLMYTTEQIDKVNEERPIWIKSLKEARLTK